MAMVSAGFHKVADICGRRESWRLRLKLIRVWKMSAVATPDDLFAMHMLFVDQEGTCIESVIQKHLMHRFANSVIEGEVYNVTQFTVARNSGKFIATHHDHKLTFNANTRIVACPTVAIPATGLNLVKTSDILKTKGSSQHLMDFMGIVTGISEELTLSKEGRKTRLMLIDMVDEMGKIRCAIFGQPIDTVKGFLTLSRCGPACSNHPSCSWEVGIQNLLNASKLFWNPEIPEAIEFKNSLAVHEIETNVEISLISDNRRPVSVREQFLTKFPRKRVGDLNHMLEDGTYIVLGTITEVFQEDDWWYIACSCMRAVDFSQGFPYCNDCKREVFEMPTRYKVKILVVDQSDSTELIMFDSPCYSLLNIPCKGLLSDHKARKTDGYPPEILDFIGQEMLFSVELNAEKFSSFDGEAIKVQKICLDASILDEYKELIDDETLLKLKFAPAFSKFEDGDGKSCVIDLTPNNITVGGQCDLTPMCSTQSPPAPCDSIVDCKLPVKVKDNEPCEKKKKGKA
ncbi:hypothetical protein SESBI_37553 [Sesbania bispinosa]|nr:hypothetical protein SESBI_37553 [Sesbania bispinosa]